MKKVDYNPYLKSLRALFFLAVLLEIHIKNESKYIEERRIVKYGLDSEKS